MSRLTFRGHKEYGLLKGKLCNYASRSFECQLDEGIELLDSALEKLIHYEDLEEQGKLLELPCKVGDTVYLIYGRYTPCSKYGEEFEEYSCQGCKDECDSRKEYCIHKNVSVDLEWIARHMNDFGKTVFITKEEAEKALKEKEN